MEKIINLLINNWTKGVDTYTHNGSTWLIFSESKQWVIELTESKTLWYNYNFFKELFSLTSMDVVDNQHYITKWVEDNMINKVKDTILEKNITEGEVDDIIQDGVKETSSNVMIFQSMKVEDTIQNGVKHTITSENRSRLTAENIIENGVKHTEIGWHQCNNIDDAIEKGVKETMFNQGHKQLTVKNIIENGVKEIYDYKGHRWDVKDVIQDGVRDISPMTQYTDWQVEEIIENGVKETHSVSKNLFWQIGDTIQNGVKETNHIKNNVRETKQFEEHLSNTIDEVIKDGVKETKTPGNGDIASTAEWMKENNSTSYPKMIDDVIENGVKETLVSGSWNNDKMDKVIENGKLVSGTFVGGKRQKEDVESVIGYGTKNPSV